LRVRRWTVVNDDVAVGQVYKMPDGTCRTVTGRATEHGPEMWHLDGDKSSTNVAYCVEREGWRLVSGPMSLVQAVKLAEREMAAGKPGYPSLCADNYGHDINPFAVAWSGSFSNRHDDRPMTYDDIVRAAEALAKQSRLSKPVAVVLPGEMKYIALTCNIGPSVHRCPRCRAVGEFGASSKTSRAGVFWQCNTCREHVPTAELIAVETPKPAADPKADRRREIDKALAEDARRHPEFSDARRAAVVAACEVSWCHYRGVPPGDFARVLLQAIHAYEAARGGSVVPTDRARQAAAEAYSPAVPTESTSPMLTAALDAYERVRCGTQPSPEPRTQPNRTGAVRRAFPAPEQDIAAAYGGRS
jgi:hypothetical protein